MKIQHSITKLVRTIVCGVMIACLTISVRGDENSRPASELNTNAEQTNRERWADVLDFAVKQLDTSPADVKQDLNNIKTQIVADVKATTERTKENLPIIVQDVSDEFIARLKRLPADLPQMLADKSRLSIWSDEIVFHDLRVQMNCRDGQCRLIDETEKVVATGTFDNCHTELKNLQTQKKLPPSKKHVVLVLHGLGRTPKSLETMCRALKMKSDGTEDEDREVIGLGYPSGEADVSAHAKSLANVIGHLDGVEQIDLVAHSLGNIVIRHYWADQTDVANNKTPDARIKRIVMIGPPNQGAVLAQKYGANKFFENFSGKSGKQLTRGWPDLEKKLATPTCEFGIIAGGKKDDIGFNPLIPGDDDLLVAVEETKLPGARDFLLLPITHAGQMVREDVQKAARSFLEHGYFLTEKERQPIAVK